jgi:hypothetical protein
MSVFSVLCLPLCGVAVQLLGVGSVVIAAASQKRYPEIFGGDKRQGNAPPELDALWIMLHNLVGALLEGPRHPTSTLEMQTPKIHQILSIDTLT